MNRIVLIFILSFAVLPPLRAAENRFQKADELFLARADTARAMEALSLYRMCRAQSPQDPEAAWRLSMACYFAGFNIATDTEAKKRLFEEGRDAGLAAARYAPKSAAAHFWAAINMALYGQTVGVVKMLFTLNTVRAHLAASAQIDPAYAYGGASRILGKIDESLPGILGGSRERALEYYKKAVAVAPDEPMNYYFLALLLQNSFNDRPGALAAARQGLAVPRPEAARFESLDALLKLRDFIAKYGK